MELALQIPNDCVRQHAELECKAMDTAGVTEATTIARFRLNDVGVLGDSTVPQIVDLTTTAGSMVAAVLPCQRHVILPSCWMV